MPTDIEFELAEDEYVAPKIEPVRYERNSTTVMGNCTHLFQKGRIERDVWKADLAFTSQNLSDQTVRGYQFWAIPYVRLIREHPAFEILFASPAKWRAEELAFQLGVREKGNVKGKVVRAIGEPICWAIGAFVGQQDWQSLYADEPTPR